MRPSLKTHVCVAIIGSAVATPLQRTIKTSEALWLPRDACGIRAADKAAKPVAARSAKDAVVDESHLRSMLSVHSPLRTYAPVETPWQAAARHKLRRDANLF